MTTLRESRPWRRALQVATVIRRAWWFGVAIGLPTVFLCLVRLVGPHSEFGLRIAGYAVTLCGVLLALNGVDDLLDLFRGDGLLRRAGNWLRDLRTAARGLKHVSASAGVSWESGTTAHGVGVAMKPGSNALHARLRVLEEKVAQLEVTLAGDVRALKEADSALRADLARESDDRKAENRRIEGHVRRFALGSVDQQIVGLWWIVEGQALTIFAVEMAGRIGWG